MSKVDEALFEDPEYTRSVSAPNCWACGRNYGSPYDPRLIVKRRSLADPPLKPGEMPYGLYCVTCEPTLTD